MAQSLFQSRFLAGITPGFLRRWRVQRIASKFTDDAQLYRQTFMPWHKTPTVGHTLLDCHAQWNLKHLCQQTASLAGEVWECGVYQGGTGRLLRQTLDQLGEEKTTLRLFDTYEGMPETDKNVDAHDAGDFLDTSLQAVQRVVGSNANYHIGWIPDTFAGLEHSLIKFAHVDVDIFQSVWDCMEFIYPRMTPGGVMLFDDYGFATCVGARQAVDKFFENKPEVPFVLNTGQSVVHILPRR